MIRDHWYAVLQSQELCDNKPLALIRLGQKMVFWRDANGQPQALEDRCCHRGAALSLGEVCEQGLTCPFHAFVFDGQGQVVKIPALGKDQPVDKRYKSQAWPLREAHGFIWLWWGEPRQDLPPVPFFTELDQGYSYQGSTLADPWPVHYSRAIENQLDVVHVPFVHRTTIGRGGRTLVHGPKLIENDLGFDVYVHNDLDDGKTLPKKAADLDIGSSAVSLGFRYPNIWQNRISDKLRIFAAFVPIDDDNSLIYIRTYQKILRVPGLRWLVNWIFKKFNLVVLNQDKRVVVSQDPTRSWLNMGEKLIAGDAPIVTYRRRRREMLGGDDSPEAQAPRSP